MSVMKINITSGTGVGPTEIAAFDHALVTAGVANFNLIYLSSVVPPNSDVVVLENPYIPEGGWGDRLYVVMAQKRTYQRHQEVWAGIGWIQDEETKKGLFVEHEGNTESKVREDIESSLEALAQNRGMKFGPVNMHVIGKKCVSLPVCALVVAVFESAEWETIKLGKTSKISRALSLRPKKNLQA